MVSTNGPQLEDQPHDDQNGDDQNGDDQNSDDPITEHQQNDGQGDLLGEEQDGDSTFDNEVVEGGSTSTSTAVAEVQPKTRAPKKKRPSRIDRTVMEFQPDVVELEHGKVAGGARWTLYVAILLIIATISWACWAEVDRVVIAQGELIPAEKPILIQASQPAKILNLHAKFNDHVKAGDVLVTLDSTYTNADFDRLQKQKAGLQARRARLEAELVERPIDEDPVFDISVSGNLLDWRDERRIFIERTRQFRSEVERLKAERKKTLSQQASNEAAIEARGEVIAVQKRRANETRKLVRNGASSAKELEDILLPLKSSELELAMAINRRDEFVEDLNVNDKQVISYEAEWRATTSDALVSTQQELNGVSQELNKAERSKELSELRVPTHLGEDAMFRVLQQAEVSIGSMASPEQPIYRLIPEDAQLVLEVEIEGRDIARLKGDKVLTPLIKTDEGDPVRIKLVSLPYQKHGTLDGRLVDISEGTFSQGQGPAQRMFYRGRVVLLTTNPNNVPGDFRLLPGMACTAEIKIGKRRVIDYFLYPLFRALDGSLREP